MNQTENDKKKTKEIVSSRITQVDPNEGEELEKETNADRNIGKIFIIRPENYDLKTNIVNLANKNKTHESEIASEGEDADIEKEDNDKDGDGDDAGNDIEYDPEIHHQLLLKKARGKPTRIDGFPLY